MPRTEFDAIAADVTTMSRHYGLTETLCLDKAGSRQQPGEWGRVHKLRRDQIEASFAAGWRIDSIEPSTIGITTDPEGFRAWLVVLTRIRTSEMPEGNAPC